MKPGTRVETDDLLRRRGKVTVGSDFYLSARGYVLVRWDDGKPSSWYPTAQLTEEK